MFAEAKMRNYADLVEKGMEKVSLPEYVKDQSPAIRRQFLDRYKNRITQVASLYGNLKTGEKIVEHIVGEARNYPQTGAVRALMNMFSSKAIVDFVSNFKHDEELAANVAEGLALGLAHNYNGTSFSKGREISGRYVLDVAGNPIRAISELLNSDELIKTILAYSKTPDAARVITLFAVNLSLKQNAKKNVPDYAKRLVSRQVLDTINEFSDCRGDEDIASAFGYLLSEMKNEEIIGIVCSITKILKTQPKKLEGFIQLIDNVYRLGKGDSEETKEKAVKYLARIVERMQENPLNTLRIRPWFLLNENLVKAAYANMERGGFDQDLIDLSRTYSNIVNNDGEKLNSFFKSKEQAYRQIDQVLKELGINDVELLSANEKRRLLEVHGSLWGVEYGDYIKKNSREINRFLEMRRVAASGITKLGSINMIDRDEVLGIVSVKGKKKAVRRSDAVGMLLFGLNGSKDKGKRSLYRNMLQENFGTGKMHSAIEQWNQVKKSFLEDLVGMSKEDISAKESAEKVIEIFRNGSKRIEGRSEELEYVIDGVGYMINSDDEYVPSKNIIAHTVKGKNNIIELDSGRVGACTFIDNPYNSWTIFNYAIDPAVVLINYSLSRNGTRERRTDVSGVSVCVAGEFKFESEPKISTILFVDSVEGGMDFRSAMQDNELAVVAPILRLAKEMNFDYVGFYTDPPNATPKQIVSSLPYDLKTINLHPLNSRPVYFDAIVRRRDIHDELLNGRAYQDVYLEKFKDSYELEVPVKLVNLKRA